MNKIKAILFDMDGVLIDAKEWHYEALNKALILFGMEISRYDHLKTFDGLPTSKKLEMLSKDKGLPDVLHPFINDVKQQYTMDEIYMKCRPVFAQQYMMAKLKEEGYKIACCSNSVRNSVEIMMVKSRLIEYLDFFLSNQDVCSAKPDPEIYLCAFKRLDLKPEECLIAEDNSNGIKAALASGGHLFKVDTLEDVNYTNIKAAIQEIEKGGGEI